MTACPHDPDVQRMVRQWLVMPDSARIETPIVPVLVRDYGLKHSEAVEAVRLAQASRDGEGV